VKIIDGNQYFGADLGQVIDGMMKRNAQRWGVTIPAITKIAPGQPLYAFINHGRWCVSCPDCSGGEYVWLDSPVTMCQSCWNAAVNGKWRRVVIPGNRVLIERVLMHRPVRQNRNWYPFETLADLQRENRDRGLPSEV
jgi:hypothetical protein